MMTSDLGYLEMIMMIIAGANKEGTGRSRQSMGKDGTKKNGLMGCGHAAMQMPALGGS